MNQKNIFGTSITVGSYAAFLSKIIDLARWKKSSYVCFANVHMVMEAHRDAEFRNVVNNATLVAPDGKPLSVFMKLFHGLKQDRVCGMDVLPDLLRRAELTGRSVYFYGGKEDVLEAIHAKASREFPRLSIAGYYSPPFRTLTEEEKAEDIWRIKSSGADLVFVSLGCPKQEKWMAENSSKLNACLLGLGQAFSVYAGLEKRLPQWMRALSLEWTYRLFLEPKRLWRRYLVTNTSFLYETVKYSMGFNRQLADGAK